MVLYKRQQFLRKKLVVLWILKLNKSSLAKNEN